MRFRRFTRWAPLRGAALLFIVACDATQPTSADEAAMAPVLATAALSSYFPPPEASGGWRSTADPGQIRNMGLDQVGLGELGAYLMSLPYSGYYTGVSGYKASNKAVLVVKNGWVVGEYYNQAGANTAMYYLGSNGKTFTMLLAGHLAQAYPQYGFGLGSRLYDPRWLAQGYPLTDPRKADITFDQVFRHVSGIVPQAEDVIASGPVMDEPDWNFLPFTLGMDADYPVSAPLYYPPGDPSSYTKGRSYSSVAFNHFSPIFRNVTGLEPSLYFRQAILDRIGVGRMDHKMTAGMGDYRWATAGNGLSSARDFARIAYLMLHEGNWNGTSIVPSAWIRQFTSSPAYYNLRTNLDCRWGPKYPADMYRTSGSGQNWALVVPSLDLILTFNGRTPNFLAAEVDVQSLSLLFAAVTERYVACDGTVVNDTPPVPNAPPEAGFASTCSGLACSFSDGSSDADGTIVGWSWTFGDGSSSTVRHPSHTYASAGSYTVALTVTDDDGARASVSRGVTVSVITLSARPRKQKGYQFVDLSWRGATGASVDVYRNDARVATVQNLGAYTDATGRKGAGTYRYRVCETGGGICSSTVSVVF